MITIKTDATYGKGVLRSSVISIVENQTIVDRISLLELVNIKLNELFPLQVSCLHNTLKLIALDYRNLNTLVKISPNVLMKLRRSVLRKKHGTFNGVLTLRVNQSIINDVIYFKIESAKYAYDGAYAKPNEKWIRHNVRTRPYADYKTLDVPSFNILKKTVSRKFIATINQYTLDSLPGVPYNEPTLMAHEVKDDISTSEFKQLACSIQNEIKLGRTVFFTLLCKRTVVDVGVCDTINPAMLICFKGGGNELVYLEGHTLHSLGIMFTQEVIKNFG